MLVYDRDRDKAVRNEALHGVSFSVIENAFWEGARYIPDLRKDYGEGRILAYIPIDDRLHAMMFMIRKTGLRIISLRKANKREIDRYVQELDRS